MNKNYCNIEANSEHMIVLIKWLIDDVLSAGGDGDGIWYSKYYNVKDIKSFIETNNLLPKHWVINVHNENAFSIGENQEWLYITNKQEDFDSRPFWQQVSLVW
jgi:hypothetical protein